MKETKVTKAPKRLYHLSLHNHDNEWFKPRVPLSIADCYNEDNKTKRVCFSTSICRAFFAINFDGDYQTLYVHVPLDIDKITERGKLCIPSSKQVFDVDATHEHWIKCKVMLRCIGKIRIGYKVTLLREKFKFKWIERYDIREKKRIS